MYFVKLAVEPCSIVILPKICDYIVSGGKLVLKPEVPPGYPQSFLESLTPKG